MPRFIIIFTLLIGVLLVGTYLGIGFVNNSPPDSTTEAPSEIDSPGPGLKLSEDMNTDADMLAKLEWQSLDEILRAVGRDGNKRDQVLQNTANLQNHAAIYLRGFVLMADNQPLQAMAVFNQLGARDIPANFLYPVYRLSQQLQPGTATHNRYLTTLKRAISSGSVSPLIAARVQTMEGNLYSALSNYLKTDPAQWVTFDVKCISTLARHSGLHSEVLRMISGALKSRRLTGKVQEPLRQIVAAKIDSEELTTFKTALKKELLQGSNSGTVAVSSIRQMLENRSTFLQRDYSELLSRHQETEPLTLPNESVLILFLSSVQLKNYLEMDRWGQEIKRRYPNKEVADWVSELTASVE